MATDVESIHLWQRLLWHGNADGLGAAAGQLWANGGAVLAMVAESSAVTGTWLIGVAGLALYHISRAVVVWLEKRDRYRSLEERLSTIRTENQSVVEELKHERREHAKDRDRLFELTNRMMAMMADKAEPAAKKIDS